MCRKRPARVGFPARRFRWWRAETNSATPGLGCQPFISDGLCSGYRQLTRLVQDERQEHLSGIENREPHGARLAGSFRRDADTSAMAALSSKGQTASEVASDAWSASIPDRKRSGPMHALIENLIHERKTAGVMGPPRRGSWGSCQSVR